MQNLQLSDNIETLLDDLTVQDFCMQKARITITDAELGPEPDHLEKFKFYKCIEQEGDPNVSTTYYHSRIRGLGVPKKRPGK